MTHAHRAGDCDGHHIGEHAVRRASFVASPPVAGKRRRRGDPVARLPPARIDRRRVCCGVGTVTQRGDPARPRAGRTGPARTGRCDAPVSAGRTDEAGFADLALRPELLEALSELGYEQPTPIQRAAIPPLLEGRDLLGQAATGTGKTAAFALPLLQRMPSRRAEPEPVAIVLVPTRELAMQVSQALYRYGRALGCRRRRRHPVPARAAAGRSAGRRRRGAPARRSPGRTGRGRTGAWPR